MEEGEGQQPQEGRGSPRASLFDAPPAASGGTARGTILAGQAHSILTTAAAGKLHALRGWRGGGNGGREGVGLAGRMVRVAVQKLGVCAVPW